MAVGSFSGIILETPLSMVPIHCMEKSYVQCFLSTMQFIFTHSPKAVDKSMMAIKVGLE